MPAALLSLPKSNVPPRNVNHKAKNEYPPISLCLSKRKGPSEIIFGFIKQPKMNNQTLIV
jgi:hypothetical protein